MRELADAVSRGAGGGDVTPSFAGGRIELDFDDVAEHAVAGDRRGAGRRERSARDDRPDAAAWSRTRVGLVERGGRAAPTSRCRSTSGLRAVEVAYGFRLRRCADRQRFARRSSCRCGSPARASARSAPSAARQPERLRRVDASTRSSSSPAGHTGALERPPLHRGAGARRPRPADEAPQPPATSTSCSSARSRGRTATAAACRCSSLDVDDFSGLNARIGRLGADAVLVELARQLRAGGADGRYRLPDRRRRVRGDPAGVRGGRRRAARQRGSHVPSRRGRSTTARRCASRSASPTCGRAITRQTSCSAPTMRFARREERSAASARPLPG